MRSNRWRTHLLVLLAYTVLALALTWPLAARFGTHVPGNGADDPPLTWNLWWMRHALLDLGTNPFDCDALFYPLGINLAFYTLTVLNGLLSIPLQASVGLIPASNILLLSSFVLSGYGAFLLSHYLLSKNKSPTSILPPFSAGLVYAFASSKLFYAALGQWNIASSQWMPFYVLYLLKGEDHPRRWRYPLLAALFLLFQAYAELTYASFLVLFTALWLAWHLVRSTRAGLSIRGEQRLDTSRSQSSQSGTRSWKLLLNLALIGVIFLVGLAPVLAKMVPDMLREGDIFVEGGGFADVFSADLLGFLIPTMHHPLFGSLVKRFHFDHTVGQHLYPGYSVLALALVGAVRWWRRPKSTPAMADSKPAPQNGGAPCGGNPGGAQNADWVRFWSLSAFAFWLLTLGPTLRTNGHDTGVPLPFALVAQLPFFEGNRYPSRYSVLLTLSLAMLVAFGLKAIAGWAGKKRSFVPLLLVPLLLFEHLSAPLPLSDMRVPPVYPIIAAEMPGDFTVLDLPLAWRNGFRVTGTLQPIIMFEQYYQTVHGKRIMAGNTSRNPPLKFQYFTEAPVINTLIALETGHQVEPAIVEGDQALAAEVLRFFNVAAIVVHPVQAGSNVSSYIEETLPVERFYEDEEGLAYRVDLPPWPETWSITPNDNLGQLSYAEGWGVPSASVAWAQRRMVRLLVPLNGQEQQMAFRAYVPEGGQRLRVEVNGQTVTWIGMAAGWLDYEVSLPAKAVHKGLNDIWLRFETLYPTSSIRLSARRIGQTSVESPVNLVVQSAGQEVGDFGHIYVDGRDVSPNERGYNVAVIHPQSGTVERRATFDTHLDKGANRALATFLESVPPGYIVAVAAADEASRLLGQEAVTALRGIGVTGDLRGKFRWGQAIIGIQGALPGAAAEASDWMRPVTLIVGEGATEPRIAAAFATITFRATSGR